MYPDVIIKQTTRLASPKGEGGSCQIHIFTLACPNDCAPKPIYLFWTFSSLRHHFSSWRRLVVTKWKMNLFTFTSWFNFTFWYRNIRFNVLSLSNYSIHNELLIRMSHLQEAVGYEAQLWGPWEDIPFANDGKVQLPTLSIWSARGPPKQLEKTS